MVLSAARAWRRVLVLEQRARRHVTRPARVTCPVCGWSGPRFAPSIHPRKPNRVCPGCGATERYRALALWLQARRAPQAGARLLEVAPIATVEGIARELGYRYASVDLWSPRAQVRADLCALPFGPATIDLVVCFHVLEHIEADDEAVRELARVAGAAGEVLVVVPWDPARPVTFEVPGAPVADRQRLYGQADHVRIYGADVLDRWRATGVAIEEVRWDDAFSAEEIRRGALGAGTDDRFFVLRAPAP